MTRQNILDRLCGGDRRSIGRSDEVARLVAAQPTLFTRLIEGLWKADPLVRMRAADAAEKASRENHSLLRPFKAELLGLLAEAEQPKLRWHRALMVPRLKLGAGERARAVARLETYLTDRSSIVKTCALEGLAGLAEQDPELAPCVSELLREAVRSGTAALRARGRILLRRREEKQ